MGQFKQRGVGVLHSNYLLVKWSLKKRQGGKVLQVLIAGIKRS